MLEKIEEKLSTLGRTAVRQTKTFTETTSLKSQMEEQKRLLKDYYLKLGQDYYSNTKASPDPKYQIIFENISIVLGNIEQYQQQIQRLQGVKKCSCGAVLPKGATFCTECGAAVSEIAVHFEGGNTCPSCGASLDADAAFCTECGAVVADGTINSGVGSEENRCPSCGVLLEEDAVFCTECGAVITKTPSVASGENRCPNCGAPLEEDAVFCGECGTPVETSRKATEIKRETGVKREVKITGGLTGSLMRSTEKESSESGMAPVLEASSEFSVPSVAEESSEFSTPPVSEFSTLSTPEFNIPPVLDVPVCRNCGAELELDARFCRECGTPI